MDRSGGNGRGDHVGRKHIRKSLLARGGLRRLRRRFLARLDATRHCIREEHSHRLGRRNSQKSTHTRPRALGDSSKILAARRPNRDSHREIRSSVGQQQWPHACGRPRKSNRGVQQGSPLVQQPPLCRIRQHNQGIRTIHQLNSLRMAGSQCRLPVVHRPSKAWGIHRVFYKRYRHVLEYLHTHPARSHPPHSTHRLDCTLTRRPVSRNWWKRRENHRQKSMSHYCQYHWRISTTFRSSF